MGKGKKRETKHHKTLEENCRNRQASVEKANYPAHVTSPNKAKITSDSVAPVDDTRGKFSKRKVTSNWDRYSEDIVSSKITEEKLVQRLSQLVEESVLQTSQSNFQPSLDALRDINTDNDDSYSQAFDIDYDYLADCISKLPIHTRLDLDPLYCKNTGSDISATEVSSDITLEVCSLPSETQSTDCVSDASEHICNVPSLISTEKRKTGHKPETVGNALSMKETVETLEDDDELLSHLLAAKTENNEIVRDTIRMAAMTNRTTQLPYDTDVENDTLLEELLAQPI